MNNQSTEKGLGVSSVLFLIFLVLKLTGTIEWSWWWVFSPLWIPAILTVLGLAVVGGMVWWKVKKREEESN